MEVVVTRRTALVLALTLGASVIGHGQAAAQTCLRAADLPPGAFEVVEVFTGEFRVTTRPDGTTLREPVFRPIARGTTYNRPIINVGKGESSSFDGSPGQIRPRGRSTDGSLEAGTYYDTWQANASGCLVQGAIAFVPESERGSLPPAPPTPSPTPSPTLRPTPTPSPSATPTRSPTPTAAPSPTPTPSPTTTPRPIPRGELDLGGWLLWFVLIGLGWGGGLLENRFVRQYRNA